MLLLYRPASNILPIIYAMHKAIPLAYTVGRVHTIHPRQPLQMVPVWRGQLAQSAGLAALPYLTGLKNLTLTGDQIMPALGVEGALASGWSAAKVACAIAGKKKDYLRDEVVGAA